MMPSCDSCEHFSEIPEIKFLLTQGKFCYFTGSNRTTEPPITETMIASARSVGVTEDFHAFCTRDVEGAINHGADFQFDKFMFKIELLKRMSALDYEYFVWVDPDNYFVRHPGDFTELLRNELIWVSMEGDVTASGAAKNWWGIGGSQALPSLIDTFRSFGIIGQSIWNTNAGMFIVRREAVETFCSEMYRIRDEIVSRGFADVTEEAPLAIVGQTMVRDPASNRFANHSHIWASDWIGASTATGLPTGRPFACKDWVTQQELPPINPAIVHVMGKKNLMAVRPQWLAASIAPQDYLTCPHRGRQIGEQLNCDCSVDREIYRCGKRGICLKRLPPGRTQQSYEQLGGVAICHECDDWKS